MPTTIHVPTRAEAMTALTEDRARLTAAVDGLDHDTLTATYRPGGRPLGDAAESLRDLVAHVSMWDEYGLAVLQEARRGRRHWTASDTVDGARLNRAGIAAGRELTVAEVLDRHRWVLHALLDELDRIGDDEWDAPVRVPGGSRSFGAYAAEHLSVPGHPPFRHVAIHLPDSEGKE